MVQERKLVTVEIIREVKPLENSDFLDVATVRNWKVVVKRDEFKVEDKVVYFEIDSFLPIKPEFEFLRKSSYKKLGDGTEGFRLKTIKLRGQISQGLILPTTILPKDIYQVGQDVTELLNVTKYEPPIPTQLRGEIEGAFPTFLPKTAQERIQNLDYLSLVEEYKDKYLIITEKLDGTSFTAYYYQDSFGVCSRNYRLKYSDKNSYWRITEQLSLKEKLENFAKTNSYKGVAIQGELIGEGIQGNKYGIKGIDLYVFNVFVAVGDEFVQLDYMSSLNILNEFNLASVPELDKDKGLLPTSIDTILSVANGQSKLNKDTKREGLIFRDLSQTFSFKVISNNYLLKT